MKYIQAWAIMLALLLLVAFLLGAAVFFGSNVWYMANEVRTQRGELRMIAFGIMLLSMIPTAASAAACLYTIWALVGFTAAFVRWHLGIGV